MAGHIFTWIIDQASTTVSDGKKHEECVVCGYRQNEDTIIEKLEETHTHSYGSGYQMDESGHWKECDCGERTEFSDHVYGEWIMETETAGNSTGIHYRSCVVCNYTIIEEKEEIGSAEHQLTKTEAKDATCISEGNIEYYRCSSCGKYFSDSQGKHEITASEICIAKLPHSYGTLYDYDSVNHYRICIVCGDKCDVDAHTLAWVIDREATSDSEGEKHEECSVCGYKQSEGTLIEKLKDAHIHSFVKNITKATTTTNGSITEKCFSCGEVKSTAIIYCPREILLSKKTFVYTGKAIAPAVSIKDSNGKMVASSDYTVKYQDNKSVGKATVQVTFKGIYSGTLSKTFTIQPKAVNISKLMSQSKCFTVKWKKQKSETSGYEIQYALDKKFSKSKKTVPVSKNNITSKRITKLKAKKKYYVRIRAYKKVGGKKYYSDWSKVKYVTTKK